LVVQSVLDTTQVFVAFGVIVLEGSRRVSLETHRLGELDSFENIDPVFCAEYFKLVKLSCWSIGGQMSV
jgi:hypothetical protein